MIGQGNAALKIFVALQACDMRKPFNGLCAIASEHLEDQRIGCDTLFVFVNKRRNRIKLSAEALQMILDGVDLRGASFKP